jgi:hypothetical protein
MSSQTFELPKKSQPVPVLISFSDCRWDLSMVHNVEQRTTCGNVVSSRLHELIESSSPGFLLSVTTKISQTSHQLLEEEEFILHRRKLRKAKICTILLMLSVVKIQSIHVKPGRTHRNTQLFFQSFRALQKFRSLSASSSCAPTTVASTTFYVELMHLYVQAPACGCRVNHSFANPQL